MVALAPAASAERPHIELSAGIDGCPSADELHAAIAAHLGKNDYDRAAPAIDVRVHHAEADPGTFVAEIAIGSALPRRIDPADSCGDLFRAVALSIARARGGSVAVAAPGAVAHRFAGRIAA